METNLNTITKEERREQTNKALAQLGRQMDQLLHTNPNTHHYQWTGTTTDLLEMVYDAYLLCGLRDDEGRQRTFKQMVSHVCRVVNVYEPHNPRAYVRRARLRKDVRQCPFFERYMARLRNRCNPMAELVRKTVSTHLP